jgi:hypothetical protein
MVHSLGLADSDLIVTTRAAFTPMRWRNSS